MNGLFTEEYCKKYQKNGECIYFKNTNNTLYTV